MEPQQQHLLASPADKNPLTRPLRRGDLVRVSQVGISKAKRFKDRDGCLGRVAKVHTLTNDTDDTNDTTTTADRTNNNSNHSYRYDVEWILDTGKLNGCEREDLRYTTADAEGLTQDVRRIKRPPPLNFGHEQQQQPQPPLPKKAKRASVRGEVSSASFPKKSGAAAPKKTVPTKRPKAEAKKKVAAAPKISAVASSNNNKSSKKRKTTTTVVESRRTEPTTTTALTTEPLSFDLYERQRRELERFVGRLAEKVDCFHHFWEPVPVEWEEKYTGAANVDDNNNTTANGDPVNNNNNNQETDVSAAADGTVTTPAVDGATSATASTSTTTTPMAATAGGDSSTTAAAAASLEPTTRTGAAAEKRQHGCSREDNNLYPSHAPYNWEMIRRRMEHGRYILDRRRTEEEERFELLGPYYQSLGGKQQKPCCRDFSKTSPTKTTDWEANHRVLQTKGVDWDLFREDVFAMVDATLARPGSFDDDDEVDDGQRGSLSYAAKKVKEAVQQTIERTGKRHKAEMDFADDRHKFGLAVQRKPNTEAAMQSWRKIPFPERKYERLSSDVVCAGLSKVDEEIASYELRTSLPDSFVGQAYRYDDTGQSEAWMKSLVDEAGSSSCTTAKQGKKRKDTADRKAEEKRQAALALTADEGVTRAQVTATMQSLLISVQDKVMTEKKVLQQRELRSANWFSDHSASDSDSRSSPTNNVKQMIGHPLEQKAHAGAMLEPEIVEQPVWGIDCYTRRNIRSCLEIEFDSDTTLLFIEKWLLPAINACPEDLAHNISNAARILEGLPFEDARSDNRSQDDGIVSSGECAIEKWRQSLLGSALLKKIQSSGPPWLTAAANQLRRARAALGPDFFRVHPKGNGSVVLSSALKANTLVTFYRGELYPSWRWGEKMDAIEITQNRKHLKPALPDFYNMALERPQQDPRGYGLLFVDASRKAGHGSSLSHSCAPTCEVRVAACNGELCLAMTTLRELEMGEELTFDYNAVTESLNEYRSAVCLCGHGRCRGSFLHFATADCYQQVLNRNSPIATRFASLVKGSMKKIMSPDDEQILKSHGFLTAVFGAIGVNRRKIDGTGQTEALVDSLDMIPVWLRTYVADTLRYIEYERRALPIALICDHLASSKGENEEDIDGSAPSQPAKVPKAEPAFFFFSRTQTDFIKGLLRQEGFPDSLNGLQLKHTMQKVASSYWNALGEEEKQLWKDKARANYEKKLKVWRAAQKKQKPGKKKERVVSKPAIDEILHTSNISFQDADAEGVVAMEQRIQQLTQTLSRVGRVLDRHRESSFDSADQVSTMQDRVSSPLRILSDEEVVGWMWNSSEGIVPSLLRAAECSRCVRAELIQRLRDVRHKFSSFESFKDPTVCLLEATKVSCSEPVSSECRSQLSSALLDFRTAILNELKEMAKEFRLFRQKCKENADGNSSNPLSELNSEDEGDSTDQLVNDENDASDSCAPITAVVPFMSLAGKDVGNGTSAVPISNGEREAIHADSWTEFYGERFVLHAVADLLLLYAHTNNFFVLQPYRPLQSTPIEVYARELGNSVSKSVIDVGVEEDCSEPTTVAVGLTPVKVAPDKSSTDSSDLKQNVKSLCEPDDIVAKVSVRYQGDYVLSQLLQWYNAGIGQKPGLPDLVGCTLLPSMSDCWSSELLRNSKLAPDRRTTYETKVRPSLVEWLQDPYQRGNPWPKEIRRAFVGTRSTILQQDTSNLFLPFGSPVIDFLVSGDDTNISEALNALDADDKISAKKSGHALLSSVDKGRPAQAVSTWVQCEHPKCNKWRKIPWHVDPDLLPEKFFCSDNVWNPNANICDAPEDDWDEGDTLVGAGGKVEGTPVKKKDEERLSVRDESSFTIGTRFDVQRSKKSKFTIATVKLVDFSGSVKRILFHFAKTSSERDEWIEFGSSRIAPLHSKVPKKAPKQNIKQALISADLKDRKVLDSGMGSKLNDASDLNPKETQKTHKQTNTENSKMKKKKPKLSKKADQNLYSNELQNASKHISASGQDLGSTAVKKPNKRATSSEHVIDSKLLPRKVPKLCVKDSVTNKPSEAPPLPTTDDSIKDHKRELGLAISMNLAKQSNDKAHKPAHGSKASPLDPSDKKSFTVGARFDVFRHGKEKKPRYYSAVVEKVDTSGPAIKILFHYVKSSVKYDEWIEYGSARICQYNSKVPFQEKKVRKKKTTENNDIALSQTVDGPKPADAPSTRLDPSAALSRENVAESPAFFDARDLQSLSSYGVKQITSDAMVVEQPRNSHDFRSASFSFTSEVCNGVGLTRTQKQPVQQVDRPFVEASRNQQLSREFCDSNWSSDSWGNTQSRQDFRTHEIQQTNGISSNATNAPSFMTFPENATRPPSFTTYRSGSVPGSIPGSRLGSNRPYAFDGISVASESYSPAQFVALSDGGKTVLSGLDMLAAVTTHGAFASLLEAAPKTNTSAPVPMTTNLNSAGQSYQHQQTQPIVDPQQSLGSMQRFGLHQSPETPFYSEHTSSR